MADEYSRPMLDVGSPRVFNVNILTRHLLGKEPEAPPFFQCKPLNNLVLIKDAVQDSSPGGRAIGTKLYFPFNENEIYEGGRTIFRHDKHMEGALIDMFGRDALPSDKFESDRKKMALVDELPSLDPFLMKDVFLNKGFTVHPGYFEVGAELWAKIETYILARFEPVVQAAFPDALSSDEKARVLIQKIWEARDLEALKPLIEAFRLPSGEALEIFSAWKGVNFYSFQYELIKPVSIAMVTWLTEFKLPIMSAPERAETKTLLEQIKTQLKADWQKVDGILHNYQTSYDTMFKYQKSSAEFVAFLQNSSKIYWELGNALGKIGQASYCWDRMTKRFPERKLPWEKSKEVLLLLGKLFKPEKKALTGSTWS